MVFPFQSVVLDWSDIKCSTEGQEGRILTAVPDDQFLCQTSPSLRQLAIPVAVSVTFFVVILTLCVAAFLRRRRLKVLLYIHTGLHPFDRDPPGDVTLFDVTVCCGVTARDWVLTNIVQPLEDRHYRTFFYSRDAFLGSATQDNVRHCVESSRRLVAVLGSQWDEDHLLLAATREALAKGRQEMVHFMTVVLHRFSAKGIDRHDVQRYISSDRYIRAEDKHFLKHLLYEMPQVRRDGRRWTSTAQRSCGNEKRLDRAAGPEPQPQPKPRPKPKPKPQPKPMTPNDIEFTTERGGPKRHECVDLGKSGGARRQHNGAASVGLDDEQGAADQGAAAAGQGGRERTTDRGEGRPTKIPGRTAEGKGSQEAHPGFVDLGTGRAAENREQTGGRPPSDAAGDGDATPTLPAHPETAGEGCVGGVEPSAQRVFVWYADADLLFMLKAIVGPLERLGHRCVLQDRDFPVGAAIQENIVHSAESCTRSVFVLSNETARNDWFTFAFHVTFDRHLRFKDHRMVLVIRQGVDVTKFAEEVQQVVNTSSVLSEDDPWFEIRLTKFVKCHGIRGRD